MNKEPPQIHSLADAVGAAEHALAHAPPACPALVNPRALQLLLEAARAQLLEETHSNRFGGA